MRNSKITTFYNPLMVMEQKIKDSYSKSPLKPKLLLEKIEREGLMTENFNIVSDFKPFQPSEFHIAHKEQYVKDFFSGAKPMCESNGIPWSEQLTQSVSYTNSSLYHAILHSLNNHGEVAFSPTSGFHHATPSSGRGFCTFSGQVLASLKLYRELGVRGAYLDLDQHHGNSIEDSRRFAPDLNEAIPDYGNFNPAGDGQKYVDNLNNYLEKLEQKILDNEIHYLVWCHGADSHQWDDLGGSVSTEEWQKCSTIFYAWLKNLEHKRGKPVPLTLSLFGGYRSDDYNSVLSLHLMDLVTCLNGLLGKNLTYVHEVKSKRK
jgi:acetoin utilization deacetylase AcuC-like enzyme